jgi:hypothetical protein
LVQDSRKTGHLSAPPDQGCHHVPYARMLLSPTAFESVSADSESDLRAREKVSELLRCSPNSGFPPESIELWSEFEAGSLPPVRGDRPGRADRARLLRVRIEAPTSPLRGPDPVKTLAGRVPISDPHGRAGSARRSLRLDRSYPDAAGAFSTLTSHCGARRTVLARSNIRGALGAGC